MAQIQAKWLKSDQNLGIRGHFAWILAIMLGFGLLGRIWVRLGLKADETLRMGPGDKWTNGWMDRQMDRWTERWMNGLIDGRMDGPTSKV